MSFIALITLIQILHIQYINYSKFFDSPLNTIILSHWNTSSSTKLLGKTFFFCFWNLHTTPMGLFNDMAFWLWKIAILFHLFDLRINHFQKFSSIFNSNHSQMYYLVAKGFKPPGFFDLFFFFIWNYNFFEFHQTNSSGALNLCCIRNIKYLAQM